MINQDLPPKMDSMDIVDDQLLQGPGLEPTGEGYDAAAVAAGLAYGAYVRNSGGLVIEDAREHSDSDDTLSDDIEPLSNKEPVRARGAWPVTDEPGGTWNQGITPRTDVKGKGQSRY